MSTFYQMRRVAIKDTTALLAFFLGFVGAGPFAWPYLMRPVDRGDMVGGLLHFLTIVLATGVLSGAIGLELGNLLGAGWERYHRYRRQYPSAIMPPRTGPRLRGR